MGKRIVPALCSLLLCLALVGLVLATGAKATLLDEEHAQRVMEDSGFVAERTGRIRDVLQGLFQAVELDGELIAAEVNEEEVRAALHATLQSWLDGEYYAVDTRGMYAPVGEAVIARLEADGSTVTGEGREQVEVLLVVAEDEFSELTIVPMAGVIRSLSGLLGAGSGVATIVLCAALVVLAAFGVLVLTRRGGDAGLFFSSAFLGAGLALLVPALVLHAGRGGMSAVMVRYYASFYSFLLVAGIVLAAAGLVWLVLRLVLGGKKAL